MTEFYDLCLRKTSEDVKELATDLGWSITNCRLKTVFLEASDWGELKRKVNNKRDEADLIIFEGGDAELNRKAAEEKRIDILLHPEKGRKDSGIDHVVAEEAAKNEVAIGFDIQQLMRKRKKQTHVLLAWRKNLKLCEKYNTPYIITSGARDKLDLRAPRELSAFMNSIGFSGNKAVSEHPKKILENRGKIGEESVR